MAHPTYADLLLNKQNAVCVEPLSVCGAAFEHPCCPGNFTALVSALSTGTPDLCSVLQRILSSQAYLN